MDDITRRELERRKQFLKRYKRNCSLVNRLEKRLVELDEKLYSVRSVVITDMPRGGTPREISDILSDKQELEARINRLANIGRGYRAEILSLIDELDNAGYAEVLEAFFVECKDFGQIAEGMGYTERYVIKLYSSAIMALRFEDTNETPRGQ